MTADYDARVRAVEDATRLVLAMVGETTDPLDEESSQSLSWAELIAECSRTAGHGNERMLDVVIHPVPFPLQTDRPVEATVVPTRMHEPGFYVRSRNDLPLWAGWTLRSDEDLAMLRRFADLGLIHRANHASSQTAANADPSSSATPSEPTS